jgi:hypothetical protein
MQLRYLQSRTDIGVDKIVSFEEERVPGCSGQPVAKAIADVQSRQALKCR